MNIFIVLLHYGWEHTVFPSYFWEHTHNNLISARRQPPSPWLVAMTTCTKHSLISMWRPTCRKPWVMSVLLTVAGCRTRDSVLNSDCCIKVCKVSERFPPQSYVYVKLNYSHLCVYLNPFSDTWGILLLIRHAQKQITPPVVGNKLIKSSFYNNFFLQQLI